jgi:putative ABC transport system permease protein
MIAAVSRACRRGAVLAGAVSLPFSADAQVIDSAPTRRPDVRTIAIDARLAADHALQIGDTALISAVPGDTAGERVVVSALLARRPDPAEIARSEYRARLHLDQMQRLIGYGDRVDRFAVRTRDSAASARVVLDVNELAFGFRAWPSQEIAVRTSSTFQVIRRFHRAIGGITIVASAAFLLCILLLKVDERRRDVAALRMMGISARTITRSVVLEAAAIALIGSLAGVVLGMIMARLVNWHFQGVHRTPLAFAIVTPSTAIAACVLSVCLGIMAGWLAARRLVAQPPLALLGR